MMDGLHAAKPSAAPASTLERLECSQCGRATCVGGLHGACEACGGVLLARYRLDRAGRTLTRDGLEDRPRTLWRYAEVLPHAETVVSLGEGMTPLHAAAFLGRSLGVERLFIKDEAVNPTASFKARGMSVAVTMAREGGARRVALPSAGNAGGAAAAYAAAAGLGVDVFLPADAPATFRLEAAAYGARVHLVPGDIAECGRLVRERGRSERWFDLATLREPYRVEGKKTIGYELAEQLDWELPDVIVCPTGGGTALIGIWKAVEEMEQLGLLRSGRRPRLVAAQAAGCAPIVEAFARGAPVARAWSNPHTRACGLRVPQVRGDRLLLRALRESGGTALSVSDEEMAAAQLDVARGEGIFPAPEAGATVVAARRLVESGAIAKSDTVVLLSTGTGLKYPPDPEARLA